MYTLDGQEITHENLHLFYSILDDRGIIPYEGTRETKTNIFWQWGYSGGWGLGYDGVLQYNKSEKRYYLTCHRDNTIFYDKRFNIHERITRTNTDDEISQTTKTIRLEEVTVDGYRVEKYNKDLIRVSSIDLSKMIEVGYYYGFNFNNTLEFNNVSSTPEHIEKSKEKVNSCLSYLLTSSFNYVK